MQAMEASDIDCHSEEGKRRSQSCNETSSLKGPVSGTTWSDLNRPKSTITSKNNNPSVLQKKSEKSYFKFDPSRCQYNELLKGANISLVERQIDEDQKKQTRGAAYAKNSKRMKELTAIADMSKIITKYDGAERRYIGTTIELVKKDPKKPASGRAIWNRMPTHRLGFPNDKRQPAQRTMVNQEDLSLKLKSSVAITTYEQQDRGCVVQTIKTEEISTTVLNSHPGAKARSEKVTRFLTEAFEANADILRLGIPFKPKETKLLSAAGKCAENPDQALNDNKAKTRPSSGSVLNCGINKGNSLMHNDLQKIKVSCIHLKPGARGEILKTATFEKVDGRCDMCSQSLMGEQKFPQGPPTTPIKKKSSKKRTHSLNRLGINDFSSSRFRTHTR